MVKIIITFSVMGNENEKIIYIDSDKFWYEIFTDSNSLKKPIIAKIDFERNEVYWLYGKKIEVEPLSMDGKWEAFPPVTLPNITTVKIEPSEGKIDCFNIFSYIENGVLYEHLTIMKINALSSDQLKATGLYYIYDGQPFLISERKIYKNGKILLEHHKMEIRYSFDENDHLQLIKLKDLFYNH